MRHLITLLFFVVFIGDFAIAKIGFKQKLFSIMPEIVSLVIGVYVLLYFAFGKGVKLRWRYLFFCVSFAVHIVISIIGNHVQPLAILAGMRTYLKFLPVYLLPMVYNLPDQHVRFHIRLLTVLAVLQLPLALYQRLFEYAGSASGDSIAGTLTAAPILTLFLIGTAAVLLGFYLKKQLSVKMFVLLIVALFIPTAINETKATVVLFPLALLIPTLFEVGKGTRIKIMVTVIPVGLLLIVGFNFLYQRIYEKRSDMVEFFSTGKAEQYLYKGAEAWQVTGEHETEVGRLDAIILAYKQGSKDFFRLVWGVGIGNAAVSFSRKFQGKYTAEYLRLGGKQNSIAHFVWEIGLLGIVHVLWFLVLVFIDAFSLRKSDGFLGPLALGWLGVTVLAVVSLAYQNIITKNELIYPFCYLSGVLEAKLYMKARAPQQDEARGVAPAAPRLA